MLALISWPSVVRLVKHSLVVLEMSFFSSVIMREFLSVSSLLIVSRSPPISLGNSASVIIVKFYGCKVTIRKHLRTKSTSEEQQISCCSSSSSTTCLYKRTDQDFVYQISDHCSRILMTPKRGECCEASY